MKTAIFVSGAIANKCANGGATWTRLSWALGLRQLGFQVYFVEQIDHAACVDGQGRPAPFADSTGRAYFRRVIDEFGLGGSAALIEVESGQVEGLESAALTEIATDAAGLINISGHLTLPALRDRLHPAVYVDLDPGFTQFWHAAGNLGARLAGHDFYYTVGENIGWSDCPIPIDGIAWRSIRQPVVLSLWPVTPAPAAGRFTTIASWRGPFGPVEYAGQTYGLKVHEFRKLIDLPARSGCPFEIALDIDPADARDLSALRAGGWRIVDPRRVAGDPVAFRDYVQGSAAEFSVAQGIYVDTRSGWFSDRTVRYLASGRPALVQDTGFSARYPIGEGLLTFRTLDDAVAAITRIADDPVRHGRAARAIAERYFDSDRVLGRLIDEIGIAP